MKVWVVTVDDYAPSVVVGVYATEALAKAGALLYARMIQNEPGLELDWHPPTQGATYWWARALSGSYVLDEQDLVGYKDGDS